MSAPGEKAAAELPQRLWLNGRVLEGRRDFERALENASEQERPVLEFGLRWCSDEPEMVLHTSGSTGRPKEIRAKKTCMAASARMTVRRLGLQAGDTALLCLPMDYIAGQMVVVRSMLAGLRLIARRPSRRPFEDLERAPDFAALVPLQVLATLEHERERALLAATCEVLIGGAPVDRSLAARLASFPNRLWSTYGMTETLSHIALRPLSGPRAGVWYEPLEGVRVSASPRGTLAVSAPAVGVSLIETNDLVVFEPGSDRFRVLGRTDNVIDSGGIKVPAETLEELIGTVLGSPFAIAPLPDPELGSSVAIVVEGSPDLPLPDFRALLRGAGLSPYWKPRSAVFVERLPRTRTGKLDRAALREAARSAPGERRRAL